MEGFQGTWVSELQKAKGLEEAMAAMQFTDEQKDHFNNTKRLVQFKVDGDKVTVLEAEIETFKTYQFKLGEKFERKGLHGEDIESQMGLKEGKLSAIECVSHPKLVSGKQDLGISYEVKDDKLVQTVVINGYPVSTEYNKQI